MGDEQLAEDAHIVAVGGAPHDVRVLVESLDEYDSFVCTVAEYRVKTDDLRARTIVQSTHGVTLSVGLPDGAVSRATALCHAWDWPDSSSMLLALEAGGFPIVASQPLSDVWWLSVDGRPTQLIMFDNCADGRWCAIVKGYLDQNMSVQAAVGAATKERRNELIAAVASLRWRGDEVPALLTSD